MYRVYELTEKENNKIKIIRKKIRKNKKIKKIKKKKK